MAILSPQNLYFWGEPLSKLPGNVRDSHRIWSFCVQFGSNVPEYSSIAQIGVWKIKLSTLACFGPYSSTFSEYEDGSFYAHTVAAGHPLRVATKHIHK